MNYFSKHFTNWQITGLAIGMFFAVIFPSCRESAEHIHIVDFSETEEEGIISVIDNSDVLRVAIATMISPKRTYTLYEGLFTYISERIDKDVYFTQILSYRDVNKLLIEQNIDIAFICTGPYIEILEYVDLLVVPVVNGEPYYQAYVITNISSGISTFEEFEGKSFVYTDPQSNTGKNYPVLRLNEISDSPDNFFGSTIYSYSHDISIDLVSKNLVDGASIDGLIYDFFAANDPDRIKNIKIIEISEKYGIPPIVVPSKMNSNMKNDLRDIFTNMHKDPLGRDILNQLNIDRFIFVEDTLYRSAINDMIIL